MARLLSTRDAGVWAACFLAASLILIAVGFASDDPDSALYANLSARLADGAVSHWIAPEWWGNWDSHGWFREHPAGVFLLPTAVAALGVPGVQASYIVGIAAGLASLLLAAHLVARVTTRADARAVLVLLQIMPLASIFRIRANHEYPMLVCLLLALVGADLARRSWRWVWMTALAIVARLVF
jgi:4-amino-4-deoxy-L-arabinose transferase-like glycosyltransferase